MLFLRYVNSRKEQSNANLQNGKSLHLNETIVQAFNRFNTASLRKRIKNETKIMALKWFNMKIMPTFLIIEQCIH